MATGYNSNSLTDMMKPKEGAKKLKLKKRFKSLQFILKQNTNEFCENTTLHGLRYLTSNDLYPMERIFFALAFITVVIIAGVLIGNVLMKWSTTPVIFSINPQPTFITNEPFSALTICNMNQAYKTKALQYNKNSTEYAIIQMMCKREVDVTVANTINNWSTLNQFITDISQPCENMLLSCRFGGIDYNCNQIFRPIITDEGLCCAFNMVHPKFMYTPGTTSLINQTLAVQRDMYTAVPWSAEYGYPKKLPKNFYPHTAAGTGESLGLTVTLDVQADEYYCSSTNSIGFKMAMHSPTETPNVREVGLLLAAGYETKARVRLEKLEADQKLHHVHQKHRQCQFQDEHRLNYFSTYTQPNCEAECVASSLMHHCGCLSHYMPKNFANVTVCSIYDVKCVERIRLHSMLNDDDDNERECDEICLPSCYDLRFYAEFFSTPLQYSGFNVGIQRLPNMSAKYVKDNIAILTMYYKDNSFRSNKQTEFIGMTDVLSSVGGLIGLFFGFSFVSLAEILFYACIRPWRKVRNIQTKSKVTKHPMDHTNSPIAVANFSAHPHKYRRTRQTIFHVSPKMFNVSKTTKLENYSNRQLDLYPDKSSNMQEDWRQDYMS